MKTGYINEGQKPFEVPETIEQSKFTRKRLRDAEKAIYYDVKKTVLKAESKFPDYNSPHEGYGIIKEEFDELWDEIKKSSHDYKRMYEEARDVACTAIRFMKMCKTKDLEIR